MKQPAKWALAISAFLLFALTAGAQTLRFGDLLEIRGCSIGICPTPSMSVYNSRLEYRGQWDLGNVALGAILTAPDASIVMSYSLDRYSRSGLYLGSYPHRGDAIAFDRSGFLYAVDGRTGPITAYKMSVDAVVDDFVLPHSFRDGDLSPDQCTLYYRDLDQSIPSIYRFDVCTHQELEPIPIPVRRVRWFGGFRVLRDGTILAGADDTLYQLSSSGEVLRKRVFGGIVQQPVVAADARTVWIPWYDTFRGAPHLFRLDLVSLDLVEDWDSQIGLALGAAEIFAVYGEPRASYEIGKRSRRVRRH